MENKPLQGVKKEDISVQHLNGSTSIAYINDKPYEIIPGETIITFIINIIIIINNYYYYYYRYH